MDSIMQGIGFGYSCLSGMVFRQNPENAKEREVCGVSYETVTATLLIGTIDIYASNRLVNPMHRDTPELFWKELEGHQRPAITGPIIVMGQRIADDLNSIQKDMFLQSNAMSQLFFEQVQTKGLKPKTVLDLGCGVGANSIPLLKHGIVVKAIDNMKCVLDVYENKIKRHEERKFVSLKCADITNLEKYTEANFADVVIATDVLPYIPILHWKSTMEKIVFSLKPGGYFFGTIFVKKSFFNSPVISVHEKFGAQYYVIANLAERLMKHSGLEMVECRVREDGHGVYDFVARKPILDDEEVFFEDSRLGEPLMLKDDEEELMRQFMQAMGDRRGF